MISGFSRAFLLTLSILLCPLFDFQASARWGTEDEANVEVLNNTMVYKVNKDGSWTLEKDVQMKILTEEGRHSFATQMHAYDATRETFEVLEAKTIDEDGIEHIVLRERMEDKPLASGPLGLSKQHQILIPFECVTVGSVLHIKRKSSCFKPDFEAYFAKSLSFDDGSLWKAADITIESELPLFFKVNDPRQSLNIVETQDDSKHTFRINLKKPIFEELVNEPNNCHGEPDIYTTVSFSTEKNYERLGTLGAALYKSVLNEPLPKALEEIRKIASKIDNETDCIDTIVAHLIDNITYLGSWNVAEGHYAPRSLETVITSGSGDCKEYASCLVAILNKLEKGYKAKVSAIGRDEVYLEEKEALPNLDRFFNHVIVKVIAPSGKTYWIDPTNRVSMATGIFPDIADRPALVLDPENPTYEHVPPIDYRHSIYTLEQTITIGEEDVKVEGFLLQEGESSKPLTEHLITHPQTLIKETYIKHLCKSKDPIDPCVTLPEVYSRRVMPLKMTFSYGDDHAMNHTNLGNAFPLRSNWHTPYIEASLKNEGALYVGHPETIITKGIFKNVSAQNLDGLAFSLQTPWLNAKRELSMIEEDLVVTVTVEKLKSLISAKDLKSEEFNKLKKTLHKYCDGVSIILSK